MPVFSRGRGGGQSDSGPFPPYRGRGGRGGGFRGGFRGAPPPFRGRGRGGPALRGNPRFAHPSTPSSSSSNQIPLSHRRRASDSSHDPWSRDRDGERERDRDRQREWEESKGEDESEDRIGGKREEKEWRLKPEDVVDEFKKQGHFDALRKVLLSQFSQSNLKEPLLKSIQGRLMYSLEKDIVYRVEEEVLASEPGGGVASTSASGISPVKGKGRSRSNRDGERDSRGSERGREREKPREVQQREWGKRSESSSGSKTKSNHYSYTSSVEGVNFLTQDEINTKVKQVSSNIKDIDARLRHAENLKVLERSQIFEDLLGLMKNNDERSRSSSSRPRIENESESEQKDGESKDSKSSKPIQSQAFLSKESKIGKQIQDSLFNVIKADRKRLRREERLEKGEEDVEEDSGEDDEAESEEDEEGDSGEEKEKEEDQTQDQEMKVDDGDQNEGSSNQTSKKVSEPSGQSDGKMEID